MPKPVIGSKDDVLVDHYYDLSKATWHSPYDEPHYARMPGDPSQHTVQQINAALEKMPHECIFFPLPIPWHHYQTPVIVAATPDAEPEDVFLAAEVRMLEHLSRFPPHPNLVKYHDCRARKGHITAIQLRRVEGSNPFDHVRSGRPVDKMAILAGLASAVDHLHRVAGIAHNDIQPMNVMMSPDGRTPTLVDLGSADVLGAELIHNRPYTIWGEDPLDLNQKTLLDGPGGLPTSRKSRDLATLKRLAVWIDDPVDLVQPEIHAGSSDSDSPAADSNTCHDETREAGRMKRKLDAEDI
ncbi:hypothetical protein B0H63DRAFT_454108 [Podospora didyma]|uniref:Protein kinase domain-containing protein n=1 Tax=Podospora didyma TaxID=330526 RepID=A0AAE0K5T0_9PEZI|nr:hypothetical protein B0H63DRAFT_454108 [Podospora didyma]